MLSARYLRPAQRACSACRPASTKFHIQSHKRSYTTDGGAPKPKSSHSNLYSNTFPAMIPVFLLGSAVYLGLQLMQLKLSHEKYMEETSKRVVALEAEIEALQEKRANQLESTPDAGTTPPKDKHQPSLSRWRWW